jgi:hypothetical protein
MLFGGCLMNRKEVCMVHSFAVVFSRILCAPPTRPRGSSSIAARNLLAHKKLREDSAKQRYKLGVIGFYGIIISFILLMTLSEVTALGLTPARTTLDFSPGLQKTISFTIVNSEKKDMNLVVAVQGELKDYITIDEPSFFMSASQESRQVNYQLNFPKELNPGPHTAEIVVLQLPQQGSLNVTYVGAALAVVSEFVMNVPYPGKYIESRLDVFGPDNDGNYKFLLPLLSRGSFDIIGAGGTVDIRCPPDGKVIATLNTEKVSLAVKERKDISTTWTPTIQSENCKATASLVYDDEKPLTFEKTFEVGGEVLSLVNMEVNDFSLGGIAKFNAVVRNNVGEKVQGAYLEMEVYDKSKNVLARFKSPSQDIEPQQKTNLQLFWDTAGVRPDTYDSTLFLNYNGKTDKIDFQMVVSESDISFIGLGYVIAKPTKASSGGSSLMYILVVLVGLLILINLSWFLFLRKRLGKK